MFPDKCKNNIKMEHNGEHSMVVCVRGKEQINCNQEYFDVGTKVTVQCIPDYRPTEIR